MNNITTINRVKPHVSVIVPVYKSEKFIRKCVDSILSQTYKDFEIILVDDGSPDRCGEICDEYARCDECVRVIHKTNGGVSSARNAGIKHANGEWLAFVDSDDWIMPDYLETLVIAAVHKESLVVCQGFYINQTGPESWKYIGIPQNKHWSSVQDRYMDAEYFHVLNSPYLKLFNAKIVKAKSLYFDERISLGEDHLFVLDYLLHCPNLQIVEGSGYRVTRYGNTSSLTASYKPSKNLVLYAQLALQKRLILAEMLGLPVAFRNFAYSESKIFWYMGAKSLFASQSQLSTLECKDQYARIRKELSSKPFSETTNFYYSGACRYDAWIVPRMGYRCASLCYRLIFLLKKIKNKYIK